MKRNFLPNLILLALFAFGSILTVKAQDDSQFSENAAQTADQTQKRPNLLLELNLSRNQLQEIRRLNQEKKPLMQEAQRNLRFANKQLDEAIYADNVDENLIQTRLLAVQKAHTEVLKIRSGSETAVRRVLTSDQLIKFRQMRDQFEQARENQTLRRQNQNNQPNAPVNSLQNRRLKRQRLKILNNIRNSQ